MFELLIEKHIFENSPPHLRHPLERRQSFKIVDSRISVNFHDLSMAVVFLVIHFGDGNYVEHKLTSIVA